MVYLEINKKNYKSGSPSAIDKLNKIANNKDSKLFILIYMEGCGPCNATRPEWSKLKNVLSSDIMTSDKIGVISLDKDLCNKVNKIGKEPGSFPTMRFISNGSNISENYEDSDIDTKDRSIDSFVDWIKSKVSEEIPVSKLDSNISQKALPQSRKKLTRKMRGGKWSLKYKRSINCKRPKGFSQRQYCKYSRKRRA